MPLGSGVIGCIWRTCWDPKSQSLRLLVVSRQAVDEADVAVMFHRDDQPPGEGRVLSPMEAAALGYRVSARGSRLTLRCPYSAPHSYLVKVLGDYEMRPAAIAHLALRVSASSPRRRDWNWRLSEQPSFTDSGEPSWLLTPALPAL